jgi:hypothetical protein
MVLENDSGPVPNHPDEWGLLRLSRIITRIIRIFSVPNHLSRIIRIFSVPNHLSRIIFRIIFEQQAPTVAFAGTKGFVDRSFVHRRGAATFTEVSSTRVSESTRSDLSTKPPRLSFHPPSTPAVIGLAEVLSVAAAPTYKSNPILV